MENQKEIVESIIKKMKKTSTHTSKQNLCKVCGKEVRGGDICSTACLYRYAAENEPQKLIDKIIPMKYAKAKLEDFPDIMTKVKKSITGEWEGFFISGGIGRGKTHLAAAVAREMLNYSIVGANASIVWRLVPKLLCDIKEGWAKGEQKTKVYEDCKLLILDDLGAEQTTDWSMTTLYTIIATRIDHCRKTIITSNMTLSGLAKIEPRIASRLSSPDFLKIELKGEDRRVKR